MAALLSSVATKPLISQELLSNDGLKDAPRDDLKAGPEDSQKGTSTLPERDVESGETLLPGLDPTENERRWGFIQKVCLRLLGARPSSLFFV